MYDSREKLFGNFSQWEVAKSFTADRNGIDNTPNDEQLFRAKMLAEHCLMPIRTHYWKPFTPNSWFRCPSLERVICARGFERWSKKNGYKLQIKGESFHAWHEYIQLKTHPSGGAADIEVPGVSNNELFTWCSQNLEFDQLIREFARANDPYSGWVHISFNKDHNRNEVFHI